MITEIVIKNIVLIRQLELNLTKGLSTLTGETGAGKSILLDALALALGGRGDGKLVRLGAEIGEVTARFEVNQNHLVNKILKEHGLNDEQGILILRRTQNVDGRTKAYINDRPVGVGLLQEVGKKLVEIHGQHEDRSLIDPNAHRKLIDMFGGHTEIVQKVRNAYEEWKESVKEYEDAHKKVEQVMQDAEYNQVAVRELNALKPKQGEEENLDTKRRLMMKSQKVAGDIEEATGFLGSSAVMTNAMSDEGHTQRTTPLVNEIAALARKLEKKDPELFGVAVGGLDAALNSLETVDDELVRLAEMLDFNPHELEETEERLFALRAAARKYNTSVDGLEEYLKQAEENLRMLDVGEEALQKAQMNIAQKQKALQALTQKLSQKRKEAGKQLRKTVLAELPELRLEGADFLVEQTEEEVTPNGTDKIEFLVQTNPTTRSGPLKKVASGGELSRFMLALKVALAGRGSAPTLIFDEVDTGAGGAMADAIGVRLKRLAENVQVVCVTHAPQVAALSSTHFVLTKNGSQESCETLAQKLEEDEKLEEVARMLSGAEVSEAARSAASQLIQTAA